MAQIGKTHQGSPFESTVPNQGKKPLPTHAGKRRLMAPGGRLMAENDRPWGILACN